MNQNEPHSTTGSADAKKLAFGDLQAVIDAAAKYGLFPPIDVEMLAATPFTILISPKAPEDCDDLSRALEFVARKLFPNADSQPKFLFRGVKLPRLGQIASTGCDVTPSSAPIHASPYAKKALEYGDVVMVFNPAKLDKTFRKVPESECPETLRRLREEYPTVREVDGDWWFSKLPPDDDRIGNIYEFYYTFCIPGDPSEALLLLFLVGKNRDELRTEFAKCAKSSSN